MVDVLTEVFRENLMLLALAFGLLAVAVSMPGLAASEGGETVKPILQTAVSASSGPAAEKASTPLSEPAAGPGFDDLEESSETQAESQESLDFFETLDALSEVEVDTETLRRRDDYLRALVVSENAVSLIQAGMSDSAVARKIGVSLSTFRRFSNTSDMADLLEAESWRIARHLEQRDLSQEKYLALATAFGVLVDKMRLLREQPTGITRTERGEVDIDVIRELDRAIAGPRTIWVIPEAESNLALGEGTRKVPGADETGLSPPGGRAPGAAKAVVSPDRPPE